MLLPSAVKPLVIREADGSFCPVSEIRNVAVFPGSFNPLHAGHKRLRRVAEERLGKEVIFELSVTNVEKKPPTEEDVLKRLTQFDADRVAITNAARFSEKSLLFPECWFVVGFDTAERILDQRFYSSEAKMVSALNALLLQNHRFLVGGRVRNLHADSPFCGVAQLNVPSRFRRLFVGINEESFREDISSTQLRER